LAGTVPNHGRREVQVMNQTKLPDGVAVYQIGMPSVDEHRANMTVSADELITVDSVGI
jgi:hypothetical protein